jgi:hypothetical protein
MRRTTRHAILDLIRFADRLAARTTAPVPQACAATTRGLRSKNQVAAADIAQAPHRPAQDSIRR